jgi:hypothetical protein
MVATMDAPADAGTKRSAAEAMKRDGFPREQIQTALGINPHTYFAWFPEEDTHRQRMRRLRQMGWNNAAIGRRFGCSRQRVNVAIGTIESEEGDAVPATFNWRTIPSRKERALEVARQHGALDEDGNPDLGALLSLIAAGRLVVAPTEQEARERALEDAFGSGPVSRRQPGIDA